MTNFAKNYALPDPEIFQLEANKLAQTIQALALEQNSNQANNKSAERSSYSAPKNPNPQNYPRTQNNFENQPNPNYSTYNPPNQNYNNGYGNRNNQTRTQNWSNNYQNGRNQQFNRGN